MRKLISSMNSMNRRYIITRIAKKTNNLTNITNNYSKKFCYIWNQIKRIEDSNDETSKIKSKSESSSNKYLYVDMKFGNDARELLNDGILEMSDTVSKTFGPLGKNVAIGENKNPVIVTKDGVTVAKYIKFSSRKKNLGCRLLSSISGSTNIHAGDGTTTSTVLGAEIVR